MRLVILDQDGHELEATRVSLINGGVEIVIAGAYVTTTTDTPNERTKPDTRVAGHGDAERDGPKCASMFDNGGESPADRTDVSKSASDAGSDSAVVPEQGDSAGLEFDKTGRAWDVRIDSSNKKKVISTGIWCRRRNLDDGFYAATVSELLNIAILQDLGELPADEELPTAPAEEELPTAPADEELPTAPADEELPTAPADEELPTAPAEEVPLPDNNEIGSDDDDLTDILSGW